MKKYILEFKGIGVNDEFCNSASEYFDKFISDDSKRTILIRLPNNTEMSVRELNTETGVSGKVPELIEIQSVRQVKYVKRGFFRRVISYFI